MNLKEAKKMEDRIVVMPDPTKEHHNLPGHAIAWLRNKHGGEWTLRGDGNWRSSFVSGDVNGDIYSWRPEKKEISEKPLLLQTALEMLKEKGARAKATHPEACGYIKFDPRADSFWHMEDNGNSCHIPSVRAAWLKGWTVTWEE